MKLTEKFFYDRASLEYFYTTSLKKLSLFHQYLSESKDQFSGMEINKIDSNNAFTVKAFGVVLKFELLIYKNSDRLIGTIIGKRLTPSGVEFMVDSFYWGADGTTNIEFAGGYARITDYSYLIYSHFLEKALSKDIFEQISKL